jgi:cobalt-zinc-cadmium efflux system membrane fusion protein
MVKLDNKVSLILFGALIFLVSCKGGNKPAAGVSDAEALPENIVEMREDQIKLAGIQTGSIEMRSLNNTLKVNGVISFPCLSEVS